MTTLARCGKRTALDDGVDLLGVERLALEQRVRQRVELVAVLDEHLARDLVLLGDDAA